MQKCNERPGLLWSILASRSASRSDGLFGGKGNHRLAKLIFTEVHFHILCYHTPFSSIPLHRVHISRIWVLITFTFSNRTQKWSKPKAITNISWELLGTDLDIWAWASKNVKLTKTKMQMNNGKDLQVLGGKTMLIFNFCRDICDQVRLFGDFSR